MAKKDPRVDAYIERSADFAKPILRYLRSAAFSASPDVEETVKWGMPHYTYKGILFGMGAFKEHCAFGFWKSSLVVGSTAKDGMGNFGKIRSVADLPSKSVLSGYVRKAMKLNAEGIKSPRRVKAASPRPVVIPPELAAALRKNKAAATTFKSFSPSNQREYTEWISSAKGSDTRKLRLDTAIEWMAEGKTRNWKYMKRAPR